ncbi:MAG: hypothetical protein A2Y38_13780 [Spirochaetes bacterium GWB1_59_5]|nr:MAG: hypothetical protein A2Y38_13780 [Spirochaetes bacterium GWB1_59_5]
MPNEFDDDDEQRFLGFYRGVVVDNKDPEKLGRVILSIPGLSLDRHEAWALPCGTMGGGSGQRGSYLTPDEGADVVVFFEAGDLDFPFFMCANHGVTDDGSEIPTPIKDDSVTPEEAPQIRVIQESKQFLIYIDDRKDREALVIKDKVSEDSIEFDGKGQGITIRATAGLILHADGIIDIRGLQVQIQGRPVDDANGDPI